MSEAITKDKIRNVAIIAHVDHGKTTLIDELLKQSGTFRESQEVADRVMDSNDLERERGITILAKCTAVYYEGYKVNIVDTPGHADFGGEVERVLSMVDGVVLLVDAAEGVMPQTKFVVSKALKIGLRPIVVINKIDRSDERHNEVLDEIWELFELLGATDEQLDFPTFYASGRSGWCVDDLSKPHENLTALFNKIVEHVPSPTVAEGEDFSMLVTMLAADKFFGRILTGKAYSGSIKVGSSVKSISLQGEEVESFRLTKLFTYHGVERIQAERVCAGDIVAIAGTQNTTVSNTIVNSTANISPIPTTPVDPPTMSISIGVNTSPLAGREGSKLTSRLLRDRLFFEDEVNVAIEVKESGESGETFEVGGRGELQLGILVETMRREGFELSVSRPKVLIKKDDSGATLEPYEEVTIDVDDEFSGVVIEKLNIRKGEMRDMIQGVGGKTRIIFHIPSRGLIGYQGQFLTDTRGTGVLNRVFLEYGPYKGKIDFKRNGALISTETGDSVAYALFNLEERGTIFVSPGAAIYEGMIIGESAKDSDMEVNPLKGKQLTNVRASGTDEAIKLSPPKSMTLEEMISYILDDELVEVTPVNLRLRKRYLDPNQRKRMRKSDNATL